MPISKLTILRKNEKFNYFILNIIIIRIFAINTGLC